MNDKSREQMKNAMMQSQKLEAIGTLAGGIAHNFNNILYAIKGYVSMARQDTMHDDVTYQNLGKVLDAVERGQELVNSILSFSRRDHERAFEPVVLRKAIESALGLLQSTLPPTVELRMNIALQDEAVLGNYTQLQQVFLNLIRNAVQAMSSTGIIQIVASVENDISYLKSLYPGLPYPTYCMVNVIDQGSGIREEVLERIFEPFFTTKEVDQGTGLGLATARSIVKDHGGEILIKSLVGSGSCFSVLLPLSQL
jgi:two-component system cell cycle sensor histidine kinase/response regulator CckA